MTPEAAKDRFRPFGRLVGTAPACDRNDGGRSQQGACGSHAAAGVAPGRFLPPERVSQLRLSAFGSPRVGRTRLPDRRPELPQRPLKHLIASRIESVHLEAHHQLRWPLPRDAQSGGVQVEALGRWPTGLGGPAPVGELPPTVLGETPAGILNPPRPMPASPALLPDRGYTSLRDGITLVNLRVT